MKKLITTWIAVVFAVGACVSCANVPVVVKEPTVFEQVCAKVEQEYGNTCDEVDEPTVMRTLLINIIGAYGITVYEEDAIYIAAELPEPTTYESVLYHEMIHWVLRKSGTMVPADRCESERVAREWTFEEHGDEPGDWQATYGCTTDIPSTPSLLQIFIF